MKKFLPLTLLALTMTTLLTGCSEVTPVPPTGSNKPFSVVTTSDTLKIHARMIGGTEMPLINIDDTDAKLSSEEKLSLLDSTVIISDRDIAKSAFAKMLQEYQGTYLNTQNFPSATDEVPKRLAETLTTITDIRNTLSELDPTHTGIYYDNAGQYIYTLQSSYERLDARIREYNKVGFIIAGDERNSFLEDFGLTKYQKKHYTKEEIENEATWEEVASLKNDQKITILFIDKNISKKAREALKNTGINIYELPELSDNTSGGGYLLYIERMVNTFVNSFDTYD